MRVSESHVQDAGHSERVRSVGCSDSLEVRIVASERKLNSRLPTTWRNRLRAGVSRTNTAWLPPFKDTVCNLHRNCCASQVIRSNTILEPSREGGHTFCTDIEKGTFRFFKGACAYESCLFSMQSFQPVGALPQWSLCYSFVNGSRVLILARTLGTGGRPLLFYESPKADCIQQPGAAPSRTKPISQSLSVLPLVRVRFTAELKAIARILTLITMTVCWLLLLDHR
jgi:hypothetical protein